MNKKFLSKILIASMLANGINFASEVVNFDAKNFQIISVAYAEIKDVVASDSAILDFGEENPQFIETVKNVAKMRAIQAAKEKAGVYVKSFSKTVNGRLTDDDISAYTSNNITVVDVQYKKIPVQAHDASGNDTGKIAFMYEATVTAKVDTSDLQNYIRRDEKEKITIVQQNNDSQKNVEKIGNDFENLRKTAENKNSEQIQSEVQKINNEVLVQQKNDEGVELYYKKDYQGAISKYNEAIKLNPNLDLAYYNRGLAYTNLKNYSQAISDYTQAIKLNPNYNATYNNRGVAYYDLQNYSQAILDYNKTIKINPNYTDAYNDRGTAYANLQNYDQAIDDYTQAINLNPNYALAYYNRGICYKALGENSKAEADFAKARQLGYNG